MSQHAPQYADEELAAFAARPAAAFSQLDVATMRDGIAKRAAGRPPGPDMDTVRDVAVGAVWGRLYRPAPGPLPLVLWLHGGGWTIGDVASYDRVCRRLAAASGAAVLSLEYRLAPEDPWPASVDDSVAALRWIAAGPEELGPLTGAVAVAGDSAGGTLAVLACLRLRDEDPAAMPDLQVLVYANLDLSGSLPSSAAERAAGDIGAEVERFLISQWVPDEARWQDPDVSPYFAADLGALPPAVLVSAELDPLRDDSSEFAARLREAGVEAELRCEPGLIHNFMQLDEISPACAAAADRIAADLRTRLAAPGEGTS